MLPHCIIYTSYAVTRVEADIASGRAELDILFHKNSVL
jgi:hypothetical protein